MLKVYPLYKHVHKQNIVNLLEYVLYNYLGELHLTILLLQSSSQ